MITPTTPLEPLVDDTTLEHGHKGNDYCKMEPREVRDIYEAERSKEREVMREKDERIAELMAFVQKAAWDPIGPSDAKPREILVILEQEARALLSSLNERINNK